MVLGLLVASQAQARANSEGQGITTRVSVASDGASGNDSSFQAQISADGRFVVFGSAASNLVPDDTNGAFDAFLHDRSTGETIRVSLSSSGEEGDGDVNEVAISSDGQVVAFSSHATNMVAGDTNGVSDLFVRNLVTGTTLRASVANDGTQGNGDVGNGYITLSHDGDRVAFTSNASNLVGGDNNDEPDVFVRKITLGRTLRVSVNSLGEGGDDTSQHAFISDSGRYVSFQSFATNLPNGPSGWGNVYVRDLAVGTTEVISVSESGGASNRHSQYSSISRDGRWVAFDSQATNLVTPDSNNFRDVFLHDRSTGATHRITDGIGGVQSNNESLAPVISDDGSAIVLHSRASNLIAGDENSSSDIFVFNRQADSFVLVSQSSAGAQTNTSAKLADLAPGGQLVTFWIDWRFLTYGDDNGDSDIYVREIGPTWPLVYCPAEPSTNGCVSQIDFAGTPSASAGSGFHLSCTEVRNGTWGMLIYSTDGSDERSLLGHTLCLTNTFRRTTAQPSLGQGAPGTNCSGSFQIDFNEFITSGADAVLAPGQNVWAQFWMRDPVIPPSAGGSLSNAVVFTIGT